MVVLDRRRLRYIDYGKGPPVVLIHGMAGSWHSWLENLPGLGADHRVVALDLPGFGASDCLRSPVAFDDIVATVRKFLAALDLTDAIVAGHSMGGMVALRLAMTGDARVRGNVLMSSGGIPLTPGQAAALVRAFSVVSSVAKLPATSRTLTRYPRITRSLLRSVVADPSTLSPALAAQVVPGIRAPGMRDTIRAAAAAAGEELDLRLATQPTLVVWGQDDRLMPVDHAHRLAQDLPHAEILVLPNVGHCPMIERPAEFNAAITRFVRELHAGAAPPAAG